MASLDAEDGLAMMGAMSASISVPSSMDEDRHVKDETTPQGVNTKPGKTAQAKKEPKKKKGGPGPEEETAETIKSLADSDLRKRILDIASMELLLKSCSYGTSEPGAQLTYVFSCARSNICLAKFLHLSSIKFCDLPSTLHISMFTMLLRVVLHIFIILNSLYAMQGFWLGLARRELNLKAFSMSSSRAKLRT